MADDNLISRAWRLAVTAEERLWAFTPWVEWRQDFRRRFLARRSDAAMGGYLKCGNTWLSASLRHAMVGHYRLPREAMPKLFVSDYRLVGSAWLPKGRPRIFHDHFLPHQGEAGLRDVAETLRLVHRLPLIILIRDLKDLLVSHYMFEAFRRELYDGTLEQFVRSPEYGAEKVLAYYKCVADARRASPASTLVIRYEDMWNDAEGILARALNFIGIANVANDTIQKAVAASSFDNMRKLESAGTRATVLVPNLFRTARDRPEAWHVRTGGTGNWREHLDVETAAWINALQDQELDPFFAPSH